MLRKLSIALFFFLYVAGYVRAAEPTVSVGGYIDAYIATDDDHSKSLAGDVTGTQFRNMSLFNITKDRFGVNTAQMTVKIGIEEVLRSNITLYTGELYNYSLGGMNPSASYIQQANAGVRASENFWIDGGLFLSHLGGKDLLPKDNWMSTHWLTTMFEPFFEAGVRASYETKDITAQFYVVNSAYSFEENNANKTIGWLFGYAPSEVFSFSLGGVLGNETKGDPKDGVVFQMHKLILNVNPSKQFSLQGRVNAALSDVLSTDPKKAGDTVTGVYLGFGLGAHYAFNDQFAATARYSSVDNTDGVYKRIDLESGNNIAQFDASEIALGFEFKPSATSYIRLEGRSITMGKDSKIFKDKDGKDMDSRKEISINMGIWFN